MRLVHESEKRSLMKTIKDLKHNTSSKDQEISALQGTASRLEVYINQKEQVKIPCSCSLKIKRFWVQEYQDQINENRINLVEERNVAEAKYRALEQEKKQAQNRIHQITKEQKINVQNYQNQIKSFEHRLIQFFETFDQHLLNTCSQTMLQKEAVKVQNHSPHVS